MLKELHIRNLAVIEEARLTFHHGFHVLTGETGAGKSIIIDALSLVVGGRGSADLVRYGAEKAEIEALFDLTADHPVWTELEKVGIEANADELLIIRREIQMQGKSVGRINGQLVNLTMMREVGQCLVNIHGQHEHQSLLKADAHIQFLDLFGGNTLIEAKNIFQTEYRNYLSANKQLRELQETGKQALQMQDLYRFQAEEIQSATLKAGEDAELQLEKRKLANAEKLHLHVSEAYEAIYGSGKGLTAIGKALQRLQDIASFDKAVLGPVIEQMQSAYYQLEDVALSLRDYRDRVEFNPSRLDEIESRLDRIASLRRKYGDNVSEILAYLHKIESDLEVIDNKEELLKKLQIESQSAWTRALQSAQRLSALRHGAAKMLASTIVAELKDLQMERTQLVVQVNTNYSENGESKLTSDGLDQVEFLISPNPGEPLRSLSKIASGGELSRMMLAMKTIFAKIDRIPVLVFDEVDTGVSGRAAQAIAEKLSQLSGNCQVFSITHLPQVACMADAHYYIEKQMDNERTFTRVTDLAHKSRVEELARMLGGAKVTDTTLHHAEEMLRLALDKKRAIR